MEICEVYSSTAPNKICSLRVDSLAILLNMANLSKNSKVLLVENTKGFMQGALSERGVYSILRIEMHKEP